MGNKQVFTSISNRHDEDDEFSISVKRDPLLDKIKQNFRCLECDYSWTSSFQSSAEQICPECGHSPNVGELYLENDVFLEGVYRCFECHYKWTKKIPPRKNARERCASCHVFNIPESFKLKKIPKNERVPAPPKVDLEKELPLCNKVNDFNFRDDFKTFNRRKPKKRNRNEGRRRNSSSNDGGGFRVHYKTFNEMKKVSQSNEEENGDGSDHWDDEEDDWDGEEESFGNNNEEDGIEVIDNDEDNWDDDVEEEDWNEEDKVDINESEMNDVRKMNVLRDHIIALEFQLEEYNNSNDKNGKRNCEEEIGKSKNVLTQIEEKIMREGEKKEEELQRRREKERKKKEKEENKKKKKDVVISVTEKDEKDCENIEESVLCKICFERKVAVALLPCGHTLCKVCAEQVEKCPFDYIKIIKRIQIFLS